MRALPFPHSYAASSISHCPRRLHSSRCSSPYGLRLCYGLAVRSILNPTKQMRDIMQQSRQLQGRRLITERLAPARTARGGKGLVCDCRYAHAVLIVRKKQCESKTDPFCAPHSHHRPRIGFPVSCMWIKDTGIMPAALNSSKNRRSVNSSPSSRARSLISSSIKYLPVT